MIIAPEKRFSHRLRGAAEVRSQQSGATNGHWRTSVADFRLKRFFRVVTLNKKKAPCASSKEGNVIRMNPLTTSFVRRLRDQDESAWFELWTVFGPVIRHQLTKWGRGAVGVETARDLTQETLAALSRSIDRFDPERGVRFSTWLLSIAKHVLGDEMDRRYAKKRGSGKRPTSLDESFMGEWKGARPDALYEQNVFPGEGLRSNSRSGNRERLCSFSGLPHARSRRSSKVRTSQNNSALVNQLQPDTLSAFEVDCARVSPSSSRPIVLPTMNEAKLQTLGCLTTMCSLMRRCLKSGTAKVRLCTKTKSAPHALEPNLTRGGLLICPSRSPTLAPQYSPWVGLG